MNHQNLESHFGRSEILFSILDSESTLKPNKLLGRNNTVILVTQLVN